MDAAARLPQRRPELGEHTRRMDLGMASHGGETRYFSAAGGTGFDAQVAFTMGGKRARWQRGWSTSGWTSLSSG